MRRSLLIPLGLYALVLLVLSLWTLPALLHFVDISRNRPSLFGPDYLQHVLSGDVWSALQVALWLLWLWSLKRARGLSLQKAAFICIGLAVLPLPFGWRATSNDPMEYMLWGLAQAQQHINPLWQTLAATNSAFAQVQSAWYTHPDPYGPLFWVIEGALGHLPMWGFEDVWRAICFVAYGGGALLLARYLKDRGFTQGRLLLAIWASPLVLLETVADMHNDVLVALFLILALVLWSQRGNVRTLGGLAFGLSIAIKPVFLLSAPAVLLWFWWREGWKAAVTQTVLAVVAWAVWFIPYGSPTRYLLWNLTNQGFLVGYGLAVLTRFVGIPTVLVRLAGLVGMAILWWKTARQDLCSATGLPFLASLAAFTTWVEPWYLVSLAPVIWLGLPVRIRTIVLVLEAEFMCAYGITMAFGFKPLFVSLMLAVSAVVLWRFGDRLERMVQGLFAGPRSTVISMR